MNNLPKLKQVGELRFDPADVVAYSKAKPSPTEKAFSQIFTKLYSTAIQDDGLIVEYLDSIRNPENVSGFKENNLNTVADNDDDEDII